MRRHTPPHCTKKEQREGVHLLAVLKGKWKGWRGAEDSCRCPKHEKHTQTGAFFTFKGGRGDGQGVGGNEHLKHT